MGELRWFRLEVDSSGNVVSCVPVERAEQNGRSWVYIQAADAASDRCGICERVLWTRESGQPFDERTHCADSPELRRQLRDEVACLRLGCDLREERLTRAKLLLKQCDGWLGLAAEELKRLGGAIDPVGEEADGG